MYVISMDSTSHAFEKQNLVTLHDSKNGGYDVYKCIHCGVTGKSRTIGIIRIPESYSQDKVIKCKRSQRPIPKRIKIFKCMAFGKQFANLTPGSEHAVVDPPGNYENDSSGVWVMGVGEKVKVLNNEFTVIEKG